MNIRRRSTLAASVLAVAAVAGIATVGAAPANAATSNCASGAACIWEDSNYTTNGVGGALVGFQNYVSNYANYKYVSTSISANDSASSAYNNGNVSTVRFYQDANYSGYSFTLSTKSGDGNLGNDSGNAGAGFNDRLSSGRFV